MSPPEEGSEPWRISHPLTERAVKRESPAQAKRAVPAESPVGIERAVSNENIHKEEASRRSEDTRSRNSEPQNTSHPWR